METRRRRNKGGSGELSKEEEEGEEGEGEEGEEGGGGGNTAGIWRKNAGRGPRMRWEKSGKRREIARGDIPCGGDVSQGAGVWRHRQIPREE